MEFSVRLTNIDNKSDDPVPVKTSTTDDVEYTRQLNESLHRKVEHLGRDVENMRVELNELYATVEKLRSGLMNITPFLKHV